MSVERSEDFLVRSGGGDYTVSFQRTTADLLRAIDSLNASVLIVDSTVDQLYELSTRLRLPTLTVEATEDEKTLRGVQKAAEFLQENRCNKRSVILAIGGGIVQDIVTFTSHIYYRGSMYAYAPSTLLSMCDSCIGAKCGINLGNYKNQLGVFHSPSCILICTELLDTLSDSDIISGYGEIVKLLLTGSPEQFSILERTIEYKGFRTPDTEAFIRASLAAKRAIIEEDEYESRLRMVLNYGHTFGHALESVTRHEVAHGLAVAWGIDLANFIGMQRGILEPDDFARIHRLVRTHFPVKTSRRITAIDLIEAARRDKKAGNTEVTMALLERVGQVGLHSVSFDDQLMNDVQRFLEKDDAIFRD